MRSLTERQRQAVRDLERVRREQEQSEPALARTFHAQSDAAEQEYEDQAEQLRSRLEQEQQQLSQDLLTIEGQISARYAAEVEVVRKEHARVRRDAVAKLDAEAASVESSHQEKTWAVDATHEGARASAKTLLREQTATLGEQAARLDAIDAEAAAQVKAWGAPPTAGPDAVGDGNQRDLADYVAEAEAALESLQGLRLPDYQGAALWLYAVALSAVLVVPAGMLLAAEGTWAERLTLGAAVSVGFCFGATAVAWWYVRNLSRRAIEREHGRVVKAVALGRAGRPLIQARRQADHDLAVEAADEKHSRDRREAKEKYDRRKAEADARRVEKVGAIDEKLRSLLEAAEGRLQADRQAIRDKHDSRLAKMRSRTEAALAQAETTFKTRAAGILSAHDAQWQANLRLWHELLTKAESELFAVREWVAAMYPGWDAASWKAWTPSLPGPDETSRVPEAVRFGSLEVKTQTVVDVPPWEVNRPKTQPLVYTLPTLTAFPEPGSVVWNTAEDGRAEAVAAMQSVMLRLLTTLPAGRVRFTIIDPVGLGRNFAAFMNLADHDEALVGGRIWTEAAHIEGRLADLTAHMENVIQKYLRNRYPSINAYNASAGEVAEPFRVLVVADFPTNFTAEAARRLVSIAQSGPRCGVCLLLTRDTRQQLPNGFELSDLERYPPSEEGGDDRVHLDWIGGNFVQRDQVFAKYPLTLDRVTASESEVNRRLTLIGEAAKGAKRVEVPFEFIAPRREEYWKSVAAKGVAVPLGRAGATRRQALELGRGTSQHALVAGKTGSGKSTLLHALIVNLSLMYPPDEVELFLIDFKKGVEFKTYADNRLPHARVIAIESEREFGLSVLRRLDAELRIRGEKFRVAGAQDVAGYRQNAPGQPMPRLLLIVDEFQEFFVDDDKIAQEAAQLLDRLVRQGRAFGMHVLLGSQTLGGAYSLARSTIDQMAVRIALQCSEADAHLILSDDNSAARLLSRPGEAIYNDANGLVEGNDPFQVVWLDDDQRDGYLGEVRSMYDASGGPTREAVVFEGNAIAVHEKNPLMTARPASTDAETAYLGEAMAIDEYTAAAFRRQNGSNLVLVGQQPDSAAGMLATATVSLLSQNREARAVVIDGHTADLVPSSVLGKVAAIVGERVTGGGSRDIAARLSKIMAEVTKRQGEPNAPHPSVYLVIHGVHRLRELRRADDDFGFGGGGSEPTTPDKQLAAILREGPSLGVHALLWADTLTNLCRVVDRQGMRELAMRVAFQMNVADSSNLLDSPAASKLGMHRALFVSEEEGRSEKFRPYGAPPEGWARGMLGA